jgi:hypothetical protein
VFRYVCTKFSPLYVVLACVDTGIRWDDSRRPITLTNNCFKINLHTKQSTGLRKLKKYKPFRNVLSSVNISNSNYEYYPLYVFLPYATDKKSCFND